jgi:transposase InsO family protein
MIVHANTKINPKQRKILANEYYNEGKTKKYLQDKYRVSYRTIHKILIRAKYGDHSVHKSINKRYQTVQYGLRRLDKISDAIQKKLAAKARRYEKLYPGEMPHVDTKILPYLTGETKQDTREHLFLMIDDYSRELYADIFPDKSSISSSTFLENALAVCPYNIEKIYSDNGTEYRGNRLEHPFMLTCSINSIKQGFTRPYTPKTNGKAERMVRILLEEWHNKTIFLSRSHRKQSLQQFVYYYNYIRRHGGIDYKTPNEVLLEYYFNENPRLDFKQRKLEKKAQKSGTTR